jgi:CheY-like chemotaxis protein
MMKKNATILVVDDDNALRSVIKDVFESNQFTTLEARDGKEAVAVALAKHPDLILLDVIMPGMGGMDALKVIRQDAWGKNVPVIILTNLNATDVQLVEDLVTHNPAYYLIKSDWKIKDVVAKVKSVLESRSE